MEELTQEILDQLQADSVLKMIDGQTEAYAKAREVAEPFHAEARRLANDLNALGKHLVNHFQKELRQLAIWGKTSRFPVSHAHLSKNIEGAILVNYYIGRQHNTVMLSQLLDKGELDSLLEKRKQKTLEDARKEVAAAAESAARAQKKLADLKAKSGH